MIRRLTITTALAVSSAAASLAAGQSPQLTVSPAEPEPGSIVRISLDIHGHDSVVAIRGSMAGEPLHFRIADSGSWRALGGVPVDAADSVLASVVVQRASGTADTMHVSLSVPPVQAAPASRLAVATRFTDPLDAATRARIARENERAREVGRRAHSSPPMWTAAFVVPRSTAITSQFGTGRVFNGRVASRHLGVDFRGAVGEPVRAANRGVVALVDTFFLAGTVIYIDHGAGVVTGYLHLSKPLVVVGDTVARGQQIALVGATGRVTGPHLHWNARYGAHTVNPLDLVALEHWYGYSAAARER